LALICQPVALDEFPDFDDLLHPTIDVDNATKISNRTAMLFFIFNFNW